MIHCTGRILPRHRFYWTHAQMIGFAVLLLAMGLLISTGRCFCILYCVPVDIHRPTNHQLTTNN